MKKQSDKPDNKLELYNFEVFKIGEKIQELRKQSGMTQNELANKCGTTKSYISKLENNSTDLRLSTIIRILKDGFDKELRLSAI